jgi:hypothetical protein
LLRAERLERPEFVARIVSEIKASQDEELWNAAGSCLGDVGLGSSVAAKCLMDLIERDDIHPGIRDNIVRDLARIGSIGIEERERLVTIAASLKDQSGIRWLLATMTTLGVDSDRAADIASDVALLPDQDGLTVRAALELLFTAERIRSRGRDLALRLLDMQGSGLTADVMNVLASKGTPDSRLTLALLKRLDEERDAKALYPLERALDVQLAGRVQGELAVPALRRCMSDRPGDELAAERRRIAYEFLMDISSRTPYLVFKERWDAQGESA